MQILISYYLASSKWDESRPSRSIHGKARPKKSPTSKPWSHLFQDSPDANNLQTEIMLENEKFGDILQGSFEDNAKNATLKHLMGFQWLDQRCDENQKVCKMLRFGFKYFSFNLH